MIALADGKALDALVGVFGALVEVAVPLMEVLGLGQHLVGVAAVGKRNAVGEVGFLPVDAVVAFGHQGVAVGLFLGDDGLAVVEDSPDAGLVLEGGGVAGAEPETGLFKGGFGD